MSQQTIRQSIEALYQEAEAVVSDGGPMLAAIGAANSDPSEDLKTIATIHAEARASRNVGDELPLKQRIQNLLNEAETEWGQTADDDDTEEEPGERPPEAMTPPEPDQVQTVETHDDPADTGDLIAERRRADVSAIMADIATAVGVKATDAKTGMPKAPKPAPPEGISGIDQAVLGTLISDTVKAVMSEELPKLVKAALAEENRETAPPQKEKVPNSAKASIGKKTAKPRKAPKAPAAKRVAKKAAKKAGRTKAPKVAAKAKAGASGKKPAR